MKILNKEIEFNFSEIENMRKYENALEEYMKELENVKQFQGKESDGFERMCDIVYNFFNTLIGREKTTEILGNKKDYEVCLKAMMEIVNEKQKREKQINDLLDQYSIERIKR